MEDRFLSKGQQMTNTSKEEKGGAGKVRCCVVVTDEPSFGCCEA